MDTLAGGGRPVCGKQAEERIRQEARNTLPIVSALARHIAQTEQAYVQMLTHRHSRKPAADVAAPEPPALPERIIQRCRNWTWQYPDWRLWWAVSEFPPVQQFQFVAALLRQPPILPLSGANLLFAAIVLNALDSRVLHLNNYKETLFTARGLRRTLAEQENLAPPLYFPSASREDAEGLFGHTVDADTWREISVEAPHRAITLLFLAYTAVPEPDKRYVPGARVFARVRRRPTTALLLPRYVRGSQENLAKFIGFLFRQHGYLPPMSYIRREDAIKRLVCLAERWANVSREIAALAENQHRRQRKAATAWSRVQG